MSRVSRILLEKLKGIIIILVCDFDRAYLKEVATFPDDKIKTVIQNIQRFFMLMARFNFR